MRKFGKYILIPVSLLLLASCATEKVNGAFFNIPTRSELNDEITSNLKVKNLAVDPENASQTGALFYGYDSGASYSFNGTYAGNFKALMKQVANSANNKDLKSYSLNFKEVDTGEQFAIKVFNGLNFNSVAVVYKGEIAGINYYESPYSIGNHYGFSGIANNEGVYTKIDKNKVVDIFFNNTDLTISTKLEDGSYHLVWDFKNEFNDGRQLKTNIHEFNNYSVTLCFDEVSQNGCGNLLVYNLGNLDFSKDRIDDETPSISPNIKIKAIVGEKYTLPEPTLVGLNSLSNNSNILKTVYNADGEEIALVDNGFTPSIKGNYYVYYSLEGNNKIYNYALVEAIKSDEQYFSFSEIDLPTSAGQGKKIIVPAVTISSNLGLQKERFDCKVSISKDGVNLANYQNVKSDFEYTFIDKGTYVFTYSNELFAKTTKKTVVVNGALAINESETSYIVGETFKVPKIEFYKGGNPVSYTATVVSPTGEDMPETFEITQEGIYQVQYKLKTEVMPYVKEVFVNRKNSDLFTSENAEFARMTTSNEITGIKIPLKNNEEVRYKNVIDLNKYRFDPNEDNPANNPLIFNIYAQPKTLGSNDAESIFIKLTDVNDESNFINIRLRFINYFTSGTFVRARASNQSAFVGYNYQFASTELAVHNAVEHEEGGFQSYFNFTHVACGEEFKDMGFPLYFNNETNRLYSRPAWLTGHGSGEALYYDDLIVPWLVYDFMTDDGILSGANVPWSGFSTGEVYLSVYGKGISNTADVFVTSIDGIDFNKETFVDNKGPSINIDKSELEYDELTKTYLAPLGEKNKTYKVFDFEAKDEESNLSSKSFEVINPNGDKVEVSDNSFVPTTSGAYLIHYFAKDVYNNESEEVITVNVVDELDELNVVLSNEIPASIRYGELITLPSVITSGGSGKIKTTITAKGSDGEEIAIDKNIFKALNKSSKYTITYKSEDYVGNSKTIVKDINVVLTNEIIFDESNIVLPSAFVNYTTTKFGNYVGEYFDSSYVRHEVMPSISVTDSKGSHDLTASKEYKPKLSASEEVTVKFKFEYSSIYHEVQRKMIVKDPQINTSSYISSYFNFDNALTSATTKGITIKPENTGEMSVDFCKSIYAKEFLFDVSLDVNKLEIESFDVYLRDSLNSKEVVKFSYTYEYVEALDAYKLLVRINDSKDKLVTNLGADNVYRLEYHAATDGIYDSTGSKVTTLLTYLNGDTFEGFSSENVYLSMNIHGAEKDNFEATITKINNQVTNNVRDDYQEPKILVDGEILSRVARGETITVPKATCYDVLNDVDELTVCVKKADGSYIMSPSSTDKEYSVKLDECGTYVIEYYALDYNENSKKVTFVITVFDNVKPELAFNGSIPTQVSINSTFDLPSYTVKDNDPSTVKVSCYVYYPNGEMKQVKNNKVNVTEKGRYVVTYLAIDANDNTAFYRFEFVAK